MSGFNEKGDIIQRMHTREGLGHIFYLQNVFTAVHALRLVKKILKVKPAGWPVLQNQFKTTV